jgi:ribose transport system ATP-binding protein
MTDPVEALRLENVSKRFGGVAAVDSVSLSVKGGEILGLIGQNGSGKSTLVKILGGYHAPEPGARAWIWGRPLEWPIRSPRHHGIAIIHQDLGLVDNMSVLENLSVVSAFGTRASASSGKLVRVSPASAVLRINWPRERARARELLSRYGVEVDPDQLAGTLSPAERAMVAILRALRQLSEHTESHLFILDEPTAYLTHSEVNQVIALMRSVARSGASVVFISHRLKEVLNVCDRVTVLRDGQIVASVAAREATEASLIRQMLGRDIGDFYPPKHKVLRGPSIVSARDLAGKIVNGLSFDLHSSEILGITGLAGMGQEEVPYLVLDSRQKRAGSVTLRSKGDVRLTPRKALQYSVALVPGNRHRDGVWLAGTALENLTLPLIWNYFRNARLERRGEFRDSAALMSRFSVRPPQPGRRTSTFSGGNQQKIVLAKWLQAKPSVLMLHEPTQGVDAAAKKEILEIVQSVAQNGAAVVLFSSDYEQLAHVCHRVIVLNEGRLSAELSGDEVTEARILESCHAA